MWLGSVGNKELAAVGAWACVCHGQLAGTIVAQARIKFIFKAVTRTAGASALRATTLDHEVADYAVEIQAVVEVVLRQVGEAGNGNRRLVRGQGQVNRALAGFDGSRNVQNLYPFFFADLAAVYAGSLSLVDRNVFALVFTEVELAWARDFERMADLFIPVRDPPRHPAKGK